MQICPSVHPMNTCGRSRGIAPLILNLETKRTSGTGRLTQQSNPGLSCHYSSWAPPTPGEHRKSLQFATCERLRFDIVDSHSGIAENQVFWDVSLLLAGREHLIYSEMHKNFSWETLWQTSRRRWEYYCSNWLKGVWLSKVVWGYVAWDKAKWRTVWAP